MDVPELSLRTEIPQLEIASPSLNAPEVAGETLVRIWGRPLGFVDLPSQPEPEQIARLVWADLSAEINRALRDGKIAPISVLTAAGITCAPPRWRLERDTAATSGTPLAVIVCTRNRPSLLARALFSVAALTFHDLEIIVVDNDPGDRTTREVVNDSASRSPHPMRYVAERRPGLSWARNAGLAATDRELIAFTDDDVVVDPGWASEIVRVFEGAPWAGCVTGQILPFEFRSDASRWREAYAGATKYGFERRVFDRTTGGGSKLYPFNTGECGSGMNMAFRRDVLREIGGFDVALGAGTPSRGGEDLAAFFGVLQAGHSLVYDPSVLVSHAHRHTYEDLELQMSGWGSALTAYLTQVVIRQPRLVLPVLRRTGHGVATAVLPSSRKNGRKPKDYPRSLTWAELKAMPSGPWRYLSGRLRARRLLRDVPR
ncbi:MAG: glycosyl transferase family 2 [Ilumatobacteraceae bacterium]|nr:glycosyl transferase family 2 [Ilumatobacteraceae bacterium]